jgi:hypothetical protein
MSRAERRALVERENATLPIAQQCPLLAVSRAAVYRKPAAVSAEDLAVMALIDCQYLARPLTGPAPQITALWTGGGDIGLSVGDEIATSVLARPAMEATSTSLQG